MKFVTSILLVIMIFNLVPPKSCQEDTNVTISDFIKSHLKHHSIIYLPTKTTVKPCPEGQLLDNSGICRERAT